MWDQTVTCKTVNEISLAISTKFKGGPVRQNIIVKLFIAEESAGDISYCAIILFLMLFCFFFFLISQITSHFMHTYKKQWYVPRHAN